MKNKAKRQSAFVNVFVAVLAAILLQVHTASASTASVVVVLNNRDASPYHELGSAFEEKLRQKFPGVEVSFFLLVKDKVKRAAILAEARQKQPNLVLALGSSSIRDAVEVFPTIPIIASMVINNHAFAHVDMVTGVLLQVSPEIHFKYLSHFLPRNKRVGILFNSQENRQWVDDAGKSAERFGLKLVAIEVDSAKDLPHALKELNRKADVLIGIPDQTVYSGKTAKMVLLSTFRSKIPFVGLSKSWVKAGALYGLEWNYGEVGRQCASIAEKILSGTASSDIPVQSMTDNVLYTVNKRTARHLKLDVDQAILDDASFIFE